ncbi:hypothetical protein FA10DRAFT_298970, partial [Acaromyces ingoldii]
MSSTPAPPSPTQLLFARAVILTMELWPAMRMAIGEQWGGIESVDKRDFLISHLCDEYSTEEPASASAAAAAPSSAQASTSSSSSERRAPATPDVDDLAETLEGYFCDEFETRLDDGSSDWIAGRIVSLHKMVYAVFPAVSDAAREEVEKLQEAASKLRGSKVNSTRQRREADDESGSGSSSEGDSGDEDDDDAMDVDQQPREQRQNKPEPVVDEDGFTTVVKSRRR